jgi:prepilin-type N-terminal cleavage/methylation domain-containing protein
MKTDQKNFTLTDNNKGFTLIETLIAMAIFSIGILAVGSMQIWSVRNTTTGNITTQATQLARAQMEELKSQNISTLTDGHYEDPNNFVDANGNAGGIYTRFWDIDTPGVCSVSGSCRRITVTVRWSRLGQNRSVVLTSITRGNGI